VTPADASDEADRWVHFRLDLDNGHQLRFSDARKFGKVYLTDQVERITGALGPEPLEDAFTLDAFRQRLAGRSKQIKPLLLDQTFVAGVGNIYADEALFRAKIHPLRHSNTLSDAETAQLYAMIRAALADGIDYEGASVNWYRKPDGTRGEAHEHLFVYGRTDAPCLVCGQPIHKIRVAQRGTHFCPHCQSEGE
jgi:formamidopyrimidine-DNA glycosylase